MTITRTIWRRAHAVRLPKADAYEAVHAELYEARRYDRLMDEFTGWLEQALERDLPDEEAR